ncbi:hypothetical protein CC2G_013789 [Coprinopsis cinerea AmutBmut pab1-1]|nr:hypothetical protein CC2G_013789 [Coprinopsis cinerea AmutBmut pab1-1]
MKVANARKDSFFNVHILEVEEALGGRTKSSRATFSDQPRKAGRFLIRQSRRLRIRHHSPTHQITGPDANKAKSRAYLGLGRHSWGAR